MTKGKALALIAAFIAFMLGSFIWYVATWNPEDRPTLSAHPDSDDNQGHLA